MTFKEVFKKREFNALLGKGKRDLLFLTVILLVTFIAIGHVIGGRLELAKRMNNPYTNWINIPVSRSTGDKANMYNFVEYFDKNINAEKFNLNNVKGYKINWFTALEKDYFSDTKLDLNNFRTKSLRVRPINLKDPIAGVLLDDNNVVKSFGEKLGSCNIIIRESALLSLGYDLESLNDKPSLPILEKGWKEERVILNFDVVKIVKSLPDNVDIIISESLYKVLEDKVDKFIDVSPRNSISFYSKADLTENDISLLLPDSLIIDDIKIEDYELNNMNFFRYEVELRQELRFIQDIIQIQKGWEESGCYNIQEFNCYETSDGISDPYYYAFHFEDVSAVKSFGAFAKDDYNINVSLTQIESRDNFYLISRLANLFIYLLIIFSSTSIILYLQNLIKNHIERIKPNLGTLKAFGLSDGMIRGLYVKILINFFFIASLLSFLIIGLYYLLLRLLNVELYFQPFNFVVLGIWICLLIVLTIFLYNYLRQILFKPPGDLIYNR